MPVVDVMNLDGKSVGQLQLADAVFAAKVNPHLLHQTVRQYLAAQRAGTHKTKEKSEVSGAGRKLWRQKGTGRARIGSIRSPLWRKGGTVHGPRPRNYEYRMPRQMLLGALRSALSSKLAQEKLTVVDNWTLETHKTKAFRQALSKLDDSSLTILLVHSGANVNLERASRNLAGVKLVPTTALQPYDLLRHERLMLSKDAALKLSRALGDGEASPETVQIEPAPARAGEKKPKHEAKEPAGTKVIRAEAHRARKAAKATKKAAGRSAKTKGKTKKDQE
jgi:large subunit ribosomal protein L4